MTFGRLGKLFGGIQGKLVGLYLALTIVSLATITFLFYRTAEGVLLQAVKSHLQTITENRAETISRWMKEREFDVEVLSKNEAVREQLTRLSGADGAADTGATTRALRSLLRLVRDQYGAYHEIRAHGRDGRLLATTANQARDGGPPNPTMLRAIRQGRMQVSGVHRYLSSGSLAMDIAVPVNDRQGSHVGAIVAKVDLDVVNEMTSSMKPMGSGEVFLVDHRGLVIGHRDRRRVLRDRVSMLPGVGSVTGGHSGVGVYRDLSGVQVVGAYQWVPRLRWGLVAQVPRGEAFAPVFEARRDLLLIAGVVTAVMLIGTLLIARRIVRPLQALTGAVQAVASGQLDQRVEIAGDDEISYLTECFNQMSDNLERYRSEMDQRIRKATHKLESRTVELEQANRQMEQANRDLQQANRELEQQRALVIRSERLAAMGEMAAGIAHEINNPLTTMKNLVHTLRVGSSEGDARTKDMVIIEEEIDKINKLVLNFLRYARPLRARVAPVDLNELVRKTMVLLEPQLKQKQIEAELDLEHKIPAVAGDAEQLAQVCLNLLLNAIQASPEEGRIRVFSRGLHGNGGGGSGQRVQLGVQDQGPGISAADRERVFQPFFTTKARGSGLGLAISHRIVEEHGGELAFSSAAGRGTTFVVTLDADQEGTDGPDSDR
jgi:signal transduction histidine kinase